MKVNESNYQTQLNELNVVDGTHSANEAVKAFYEEYGSAWTEIAIIILCDKSTEQPFAIIKSSEGNRSSAMVHPNFMMASVIETVEESKYDFGEVEMYFAHNHPSGNPTASRPDKRVTKLLSKASKVCGIELSGSYIYAEGRINLFWHPEH